MKKALALISISFILAVFQSSFFSRAFGLVLNPNFVLAFAFALFIMSKYDDAYLTGFFGGLFLDLLGFRVVGVSAFVFVLALVVSFYIKKYIFKGIGAQIVYILVATVLYKAVVLAFPHSVFSASVFMSSLLTLGICWLFYIVLQGILQDEKKYS